MTSKTRDVDIYIGDLRSAISSKVNELNLYYYDRTIVASNEEKYSNYGLDYGSSEDLKLIFSLMRELNYKGITSPNVGCYNGGTHCLADALNAVCDTIAEEYSGRTIDYIELGPEPVKTELLLSGLKARGVKIASYKSVDINPASAGPMRDVVSRVCPTVEIGHIAANFNELNSDALGKSHPAVISSLGFQEGNHAPQETYALLKRIMGTNDCFLSEMQAKPVDGWGPVRAFYELDEMRQFSKNCVKRKFGEVDSKYNIDFIEIDAGDQHYAVAVTVEDIFTDEGKPVGYITNYCLKYTAEQFRQVREFNGEFEVLADHTTSDKSVIFQLTKRL